MKLKLISMGCMPWYLRGQQSFSFYYPRLGLPYLAAVTPSNWKVEILDAVGIEDIDFNEQVDLVGFSVLTPFANQSYQAASRYRKNGVKVILGGVHSTLLPEEAKEYADSVVIGEGENVWQELLENFAKNSLRKFYLSKEPVNLNSLPDPKYSLLMKENYSTLRVISLIRGCPRGDKCSFCLVPRMFGKRYRTMPIEKIIEQIHLLQGMQGGKRIIIIGCCALNNSDYMRTFAEAVKPMNIEWEGSGLLPELNNKKFLKLLKESGCKNVYTESGVVSRRKDAEEFDDYCEAIHKLHDSGISISYNFTIGCDNDDRNVFGDIINFIAENSLHRERCAIQLFTPWPNTGTFNKLDEAGRIIDKNWANYDNTKVVFKPKLMSVQDLENGFASLQHLYSMQTKHKSR